MAKPLMIPIDTAQRIRRLSRSLLICGAFSTVLAGSASAFAADPTPPLEPTPPAAEPALPDAEPTPPSANAAAAPKTGTAAPVAAGDQGNGKLGSISWHDIVTVPRRPILKYHRVEMIPTYYFSLNNPNIRNQSFGGIVNFFLSETLNIGLEGSYHTPQLLEQYSLRGLDDRVLPAVNKQVWSATLNFGYVPVYGKFALFNKWIFQWETYIQAGLGAIETQWIPRDPANAGATNYDVLWHIDIGYRMFLTKWLALHFYFKDHMYVDKFEPSNRADQTLTQLNGKYADVFVQDLVFGVGVGMFLPTNFEYKFLR